MGKYCPYLNSATTYQQCAECDVRICEPDTFFCLVVGSRTFTDYDRCKRTLDHLLQNQRQIVIVSGGAKGADNLAERYAEESGYPLLIFPAKWETYGKKAGYLRNEEMHNFIAKQSKRGVVAFWDGKSAGTKHSFELAKKYQNPLKVIRVDQ